MAMTKTLILALCLFSVSALAQGSGHSGQAKQGKQSEEDGLAGRVAALEAEVLALQDVPQVLPNSSVAGRQYCRTQSSTLLLGNPTTETEQVVKGVRRQAVTFDPSGMMGLIELAGAQCAVDFVP
jgi:hypothetical protein